MLRAVGLDVAMHRDIVLQAWLCEDADVGRQVVLQTETCTNRPLPRVADSCLVAGLILIIQIEV